MGQLDWVAKFPAALQLPVDDVLNAIMKWLVDNTEPFFKGCTYLLSFPMGWMRAFLHWLYCRILFSG